MGGGTAGATSTAGPNSSITANAPSGKENKSDAVGHHPSKESAQTSHVSGSKEDGSTVAGNTASIQATSTQATHPAQNSRTENHNQSSSHHNSKELTLASIQNINLHATTTALMSNHRDAHRDDVGGVGSHNMNGTVAGSSNGVLPPIAKGNLTATGGFLSLSGQSTLMGTHTKMSGVNPVKGPAALPSLYGHHTIRHKAGGKGATSRKKWS